MRVFFSVLWSKISNNLTFGRIVILYFTIAPFLSSAILYTTNGVAHVSYIDALFVCFSATTVCGLTTVDISSLTGFQQALLLLFTAIGHRIVISWIVVYIRRRFFNKHLQFIVESERAKRKAQYALEEGQKGLLQRVKRVVRRRTVPQRARSIPKAYENSGDNKNNMGRQGLSRMGPVQSEPVERTSSAPSRLGQAGPSSPPKAEPACMIGTPRVSFPAHEEQRTSLDAGKVERLSPISEEREVRYEELGDEHRSSYPLRSLSHGNDDSARTQPRPVTFRRHTAYFPQYRRPSAYGPYSQNRAASLDSKWKTRGFGGFPYPSTLIFHSIKESYYNIRRKSRKFDSFLLRIGPEKHVHETLFGRDSKPDDLTEQDLEELGGVEYRALNALLWIIVIYHFVTQAVALIIVAPYMSISRWSSVLSPPNTHRVIPSAWFSVFQVVSAYTTSGMSLVDQSMIPFQKAYPLILVCSYLIMAGNLAFPCFLRFFIWSIMKLTPSVRLREALQFLLDHPRRCYIYLFPSHNTWILLFVIIIWNGINYALFLTLNIGTETFDQIPLGVRFAIGGLQATSIRAAGFTTTALSSLSPAMLVLCVVVMFLGIYPMAVSIRATNVYEQRSLGVFDDVADNKDSEENNGSLLSAFGAFAMWIAQKQMLLDVWWLAVAVFILSIIERHKLQNEDNFEWFTIFHLLFETVSAYTGVGISLGLPHGNYSFSGGLSTPSKLILAVVMVRGRRRDLPVAIDRAVMLPHEFNRASQEVDEPQGSDGGRNDKEKDRERQGDDDEQRQAN